MQQDTQAIFLGRGIVVGNHTENGEPHNADPSRGCVTREDSVLIRN